MKAIIGLGNPGLQYSHTRHNVGFMVLDALVKQENLPYRNAFRGKLAEGREQNERVLFLKPYTYMNLSGCAVSQMVNYYKIPEQDILVIADDMDLPFGKIRLRAKGSAGGHNGLKSIIQELGTQDFWRLKIGVGRPTEEEGVINHVLSALTKDEQKIWETVSERAQQCAALWLQNRQQEAMNTFNQG